MSLRELRNLEINTGNANESSTGASAMVNPTGTTSTVSFVINPCAGNVNPLTESRSKLHLKAIEEAPKKEKLYISISNRIKVSNVLEKHKGKYAWGVS